MKRGISSAIENVSLGCRREEIDGAGYVWRVGMGEQDMDEMSPYGTTACNCVCAVACPPMRGCSSVFDSV